MQRSHLFITLIILSRNQLIGKSSHTYPVTDEGTFGLYLNSAGSVIGGNSSLYNLAKGENFDEDESMKTRSSLQLDESKSSASGLPGSTLMWGGPWRWSDSITSAGDATYWVLVKKNNK